jgi:hypothetical protein
VTDSTIILEQKAQARSSWRFVVWSVGALLFAGLWLPAFAAGLWITLPSAFMGFVTAILCSWAFMSCPRRPLLPKMITLILVLPALALGIQCLGEYLICRVFR